MQLAWGIKKYIKNFGGETSWKAATYKTETRVGLY